MKRLGLLVFLTTQIGFVHAEYASKWQWLLPTAEAQDPLPTKPLTWREKHVQVSQVAMRLGWICQHIEANEWSHLDGDFSAAVQDSIDGDLRVRKPIERNTADWQRKAYSILQEREIRFCDRSGIARKAWNFTRNYLIMLNESTQIKDQTCDDLRNARDCMKRIEDRREPTLYELQFKEVIGLLRELDPSKSETEIASGATIIQKTQTAAKKTKTQVAKERNGASR